MAFYSLKRKKGEIPHTIYCVNGITTVELRSRSEWSDLKWSEHTKQFSGFGSLPSRLIFASHCFLGYLSSGSL